MTVQEFSQWALNNIDGAVLSDDASREILADFYAMVGDVQLEFIDPLRENLLSILSAEDSPAVCLEGLLSLVGFSAALGWPARLSEADQRKVISLGAAFWRGKGTVDTIRALANILAGADVVFWDWLQRRYVSGSDVAAMINWQDGLAGGDCLLDLHLSDPYGKADRSRMSQALASIRPGIDSWKVTWAFLAEPFGQGLYRWDIEGTPECEVGDGVCVLEAGDQITTSMGLVESADEIAWDVARVLSEVCLDVSGEVEFRWGVVDADNYYCLSVSALGIEASIVRDGLSTVICSKVMTIATGIWYFIDIRAYPLMSGAVEVQILVDGNETCRGSVF